MLPPMMLVLALQLLRIFQSFETEYLLGMPFGFYVYSTKIFALIRDPVPNYGEATVLASMTLLLIALIIPVQRWILERRRYTTVTGSFRPGLIDMGRWNYVAFGAIACLLVLLTVGPLCILVLGSFMTRIGYFMLGFTLEHWKLVLNDPVFIKALGTTLVLGTTAAVISGRSPVRRSTRRSSSPTWAATSSARRRASTSSSTSSPITTGSSSMTAGFGPS